MPQINHPEQAAIGDLQHVRVVIGWAKNGVLASDPLLKASQEKVSNLIQSGVLSNEGAVMTQDTLMHLVARRMPNESRCAEALREVDSVLLPLRNLIRQREGFEPLPADRVLGAHGPHIEPARERG